MLERGKEDPEKVLRGRWPYGYGAMETSQAGGGICSQGSAIHPSWLKLRSGGDNEPREIDEGLKARHTNGPSQQRIRGDTFPTKSSKKLFASLGFCLAVHENVNTTVIDNAEHFSRKVSRYKAEIDLPPGKHSDVNVTSGVDTPKTSHRIRKTFSKLGAKKRESNFVGHQMPVSKNTARNKSSKNSDPQEASNFYMVLWPVRNRMEPKPHHDGLSDLEGASYFSPCPSRACMPNSCLIWPGVLDNFTLPGQSPRRTAGSSVSHQAINVGIEGGNITGDGATAAATDCRSVNPHPLASWAAFLVQAGNLAPLRGVWPATPASWAAFLVQAGNPARPCGVWPADDYSCQIPASPSKLAQESVRLAAAFEVFIFFTAWVVTSFCSMVLISGLIIGFPLSSSYGWTKMLGKASRWYGKMQRAPYDSKVDTFPTVMANFNIFLLKTTIENTIMCAVYERVNFTVIGRALHFSIPS